MINTILFDLDGTICDIEYRYVDPVRDAIMKYKHNISDREINKVLKDLMTLIGDKSNFTVLKTMYSVGRNVGLGYIATLRYLWTLKTYYRENKENFILIPEAEYTLNIALEKFKVGLVTSAFSEDVSAAKEKIPILNKLDCIITWHDVEEPKPAPEPINKALNALNVEPHNALYIGDLPTNIIAGKKGGVKTIAYAGKFARYTERLLRRAEPNYFAYSHFDLRNLIDQICSKGSSEKIRIAI